MTLFFFPPYPFADTSCNNPRPSHPAAELEFPEHLPGRHTLPHPAGNCEWRIPPGWGHMHQPVSLIFDWTVGRWLGRDPCWTLRQKPDAGPLEGPTGTWSYTLLLGIKENPEYAKWALCVPCYGSVCFWPMSKQPSNSHFPPEPFPWTVVCQDQTTTLCRDQVWFTGHGEKGYQKECPKGGVCEVWHV